MKIVIGIVSVILWRRLQGQI